MNYGSIRGVDKPVSRLVLGTMIINTKQLDMSFALMDAVTEQGCTTFDTAHVYAGGESEKAIGMWLRERGNREKMVILSKGAHPGGGRKRVTPPDIASDLDDSLNRMQTDYIDIYQFHEANKLPFANKSDKLLCDNKFYKYYSFGTKMGSCHCSECEQKNGPAVGNLNIWPSHNEL